MPEPIEPQANEAAKPDAEIGAVKRQVELLSAQLESVLEKLGDKDAPKSEASPQNEGAPQEYSREQLQAFVDQGKITSVQMENVLSQQSEKRLEARLSQKVESRLQNLSTEQQVTRDIDAYVDAFPAIGREGTPERKQIAEEYRRLVAEGLQPTLKTELLALRSVFGRLQPGIKTARRLETNAETGGRGDGAPSNSGAPSSDPAFKALSQAQIAHYEKMIVKGIYKDWNQVKTEIGFKRKSEGRT